VAVLTIVTAICSSMLALQAFGALLSKTVNAPVDRVAGVDANDTVSTMSTTFVDMPSMSTSFTLAGPNKKKVIAMFQGEIDASGPAVTITIQLVIDGSVQSGPQPLLVDQLAHQTHGFNFISDGLSSGPHTAKIQWKAGSGTAAVAARSLVVIFDS
jgi:hypothetical protein